MLVVFLFQGKKYEEYFAAFSYLKLVALLQNFSLNPKFVICDFEKSLQGAISNVFPECKVLGYEFHFIKAMWKRAAKLGLRKDKKKKPTAIIISICTVLVRFKFKKGMF